MRAELLALLQLPATPRRDFNTLTLKKSRQVLPSQEAEYLDAERTSSACPFASSPRGTDGLKTSFRNEKLFQQPLKCCLSQTLPFPKAAFPKCSLSHAAPSHTAQGRDSVSMAFCFHKQLLSLRFKTNSRALWLVFC